MAEYHIDFDSGLPTAAGTPTDPYKDWDDVPALSNNDIVRFKRGVTHAHDDWIDPGVCDGVTFEAYYNSDGSDDPSQPKPILTNSNAVTYHVFHIANTTNRSNMTIRNLVMRDSTLNANARNLNVATSDYTTDSGLLVENCEFYNASLNNVRLMAGGCKLINCILDQAGDDNVYTEGENNWISGCKMTRCSQTVTTGDNIQIAASVHLTPNSYNIYDNYLDASDGLKQAIILVGTNHKVVKNTCVSGLFGINASATCSSSKITGNTVYSSSSTTRIINCEGDTNEIKGNLVIRSHNVASQVGCIYVAAGANSQVDNNTIVDTTNSDYGLQTIAAATGLTVRSNIITGCTDGIRRGASAITESHNKFFNNTNNYTLSGTPQTIDTTSENLSTDPLDPQYLPVQNSTVIRSGIKTWIGANITGFTGEPLSDFDTDAGGAQTTYSPFHPKNL